MRFKDCYYDVEIPQRALDLGMVDVSWHNDAGPRMIHRSQVEVDAMNPVEGGVPILTFMCGGEMQADELQDPDAGYLIYWAVYGCEVDETKTRWQGRFLDQALKVLEQEVERLMSLPPANPPGTLSREPRWFNEPS